MWQQIIIDFIAKIIAACIVMSMHELAKAKVYCIINGTKLGIILKKNNSFTQYIDPVGLLLFVFCNAGFSKTTIFYFKDKRTNSNLGIFGLLTLIIMFFFFSGISRIMLYTNWSEISISSVAYYFAYFLNSLAFRLSLFSLSAFLVNLFPLASLDMGLIIAGKSVEHFLNLLKIDYVIKTIILVSICIGVVYELSYQITKLFVLTL